MSLSICTTHCLEITSCTRSRNLTPAKLKEESEMSRHPSISSNNSRPVSRQNSLVLYKSQVQVARLSGLGIVSLMMLLSQEFSFVLCRVFSNTLHDPLMHSFIESFRSQRTTPSPNHGVSPTMRSEPGRERTNSVCICVICAHIQLMMIHCRLPASPLFRSPPMS